MKHVYAQNLAEFIVRACNAHYELLKSLKGARTLVGLMELKASAKPSTVEILIDAIDAAIAKAEGR